MLLRKQKKTGILYLKEENKIFSVIILDNSGIIPSDILRFNYSDLAKDFEKPIVIRELDINKYPVFGFAFIESASNTRIK
jgi:hypothetical protein